MTIMRNEGSRVWLQVGTVSGYRWGRAVVSRWGQSAVRRVVVGGGDGQQSAGSWLPGGTAPSWKHALLSAQLLPASLQVCSFCNAPRGWQEKFRGQESP